MIYGQQKNSKNKLKSFTENKYSVKFKGQNCLNTPPKTQKPKILANIAWRILKFAVVWNRYLNLCVCTQSLENSAKSGHYYTVSSSHKVGVCALTSTLATLIRFYGRDGAEYNSPTTANNARRFFLHGFLTSRSPFNPGEVL